MTNSLITQYSVVTGAQFRLARYATRAAADRVIAKTTASELDDPTKHAASCPWRLAREWVAETKVVGR